MKTVSRPKIEIGIYKVINTDVRLIDVILKASSQHLWLFPIIRAPFLAPQKNALLSMWEICIVTRK